jgi:hypothetical protein
VSTAAGFTNVLTYAATSFTRHSSQRRGFAAPLDRAAELLDAIETGLDRFEVGRVAEAHGFVVAEGNARNDGDFGFAEQAVGEVGRTEAELRDVGHHVERTEMLGSKLEIKADPGNGTIVKAAVPVA